MTTPTGVLHPPGALYEQAAQFGADLATMQQAAADQMLAAHGEAYARIRVEYDLLLAKVADAQEKGKPQSPAWLYQRARLKQALATTKTEIARFAEAASHEAKQAQWAAVQASVKHAAKMGAQAAQQTGVAHSFIDLNPANLEHLIGFLQDGTPLSGLFDSFAALTTEQIRSALVRGIALGKGVDWMSREVDRALDMPRWRTETIMRTESQRVYRAVARETYQANAAVLDGWTWVATLDARVCPCCLVMDGTHHPLHAILDGHPRCRCAMVPRTKTYDEILGLPDDTTPDGRPPVRSGKQWLEGQSESIQRALLGVGKWKAWKAGKITLDDVVARHYDPQWGSMRRERSLKEIQAGTHPNYPDAPPPPPAPVEYAPNAATAAAWAKVSTLEELEQALQQAQDAGEGQTVADLKAALAMALNQQDYTVAIPEPDQVKAAKATAKMNAAVLSKGYPSKGYSQTVAIYKAQANGAVGSKVGVIASLTWEQKITAGKALADHAEWLEQHLAAQVQAKAEGKFAVKYLHDDLENAGNQASALAAFQIAKDTLKDVPEGTEKARALAYIDAAEDAYGQAAGNVIDLAQQADTWWNADGASLALGNDGWGLITYPSGSTQNTNPQQTLALLTSGDWTHKAEPDPANVAGIVSSMTTNEGYLDVNFLSWAQTYQGQNPGTAQQQADFLEAVNQAQAILLPPPQPDKIQEALDMATTSDVVVSAMIKALTDAKDQDTWQGDPSQGLSPQQAKSNGLAILKALEDHQAQQAAASAAAPGVYDPQVHKWLKEYDADQVTTADMKWDGSPAGTKAAQIVDLYENHVGGDLGAAAEWYEATHPAADEDESPPAVDPASYVATLVGAPWDPAWAGGKSIDEAIAGSGMALQANLNKLINEVDTPEAMAAEAAEYLNILSYPGLTARWLALYRYYNEGHGQIGTGTAPEPEPISLADIDEIEALLHAEWYLSGQGPTLTTQSQWATSVKAKELAQEAKAFLKQWRKDHPDAPVGSSPGPPEAWVAKHTGAPQVAAADPLASPKAVLESWKAAKANGQDFTDWYVKMEHAASGDPAKQAALDEAIDFMQAHDQQNAAGVLAAWEAADTAPAPEPSLPDPAWPAPNPAKVAKYLENLKKKVWDEKTVQGFIDKATDPQKQADFTEALAQFTAPKVKGPGGGPQKPVQAKVQKWINLVQSGDYDTDDLKNLLPTASPQNAANIQAALDILEPAQAPPAPAFGAAPDPSTLTFSGQTLGTHGAQVWKDAQGNRYLFKPPKNAADSFLVTLDEAASRLQVKAGLKAPDTWTITLGGKYGSLQRMFDASPAFPHGFKPQDLAPDDLMAVQQQHVLDWLLSNHDGHVEQFLRLPDGSLVGIDKGQAFRWLGQDRLAWDFHPNAYYGAPPPVYNALWGDFAKGGAREVYDPRGGPLADFIAQIQGISDTDLRTLFRPYAEAAAARGLLAAKGQPQPGLTAGTVQPNSPDAFLDALIARKNSLATDFADLYERAAKERQKALPQWKPTKPAPTPKQKQAAKHKALVGAPEPQAPEPPDPPTEAYKPLFVGWLAKAEARYQANPNKAKPNLQGTANWTRFERVMDLLDRAAVQELLDRQYLTQEMADEALDLISKAEAVKQAAEAKFATEQAAYERAVKAHAKRLTEWREANGIVFTTRGMDEAVVRHDTDREGVRWGDSNYKEHLWTAAQRTALRTYTGGTYSTWNGQLRRTKGDPGQYKPTLDKIDAAMPVQPIPEDVILHRGTGTAAFDFGDHQRKDGRLKDLNSLVGTVQVEYGYLSTSVGNSAAFSSYEVQIKFRAPKGTHGAYVKAFSNHSAERELILPRGTRYYVHAVYKVDHRWVMEAEVVDEDFQPPVGPSGAPEVRPSTRPWTTLSPDGTA